jgi:hypothetical protein
MRIAAPRSGGVHQPADLLLMRSACPPRCPLQSPGIPASKHTRRQVPRSRLPFRAAPTCNPHSACCQPVPNCPRLRALALFGRRPLQRVVSLVIPATKNLVWGFGSQVENSGHGFFLPPISLFDLKAHFFAPTRCLQPLSCAGAVKVGRRGEISSCPGDARPRLDSSKHDSTLVVVGMTMSRGARLRRTDNRAATLYSVGHNDPNHDAVLRIGSEAPRRRAHSAQRHESHGFCGTPPPRTVIGDPSWWCGSGRNRQAIGDVHSMLVFVTLGA